MKVNEAYDPNSKVWFSGKPKKVTHFYKPTPKNQMFFTTNPEYAMNYMQTGYNNKNDSCCIVAMMNQFKLKTFDFTDKTDVHKLNYPKAIEYILVGDSFWQTTMKLYDKCIEQQDIDAEAIEWYSKKFKVLLDKKLNPFEDNDQLYQFQAIILEDIMKLPEKYSAYYNWDYDDESDGGASISLFKVDAIDKVIPTILSFKDMADLVDAVNNNELDLSNLRDVKSYVYACTGIEIK